MGFDTTETSLKESRISGKLFGLCIGKIKAWRYPKNDNQDKIFGISLWFWQNFLPAPTKWFQTDSMNGNSRWIWRNFWRRRFWTTSIEILEHCYKHLKQYWWSFMTISIVVLNNFIKNPSPLWRSLLTFSMK